MKVDIARSYPEKAGVKSWQRSIRLNRKKNVTINDIVSLSKAEKLTQQIMTCYPTEVKTPGDLFIHYKTAAGTIKDFVIKYNTSQMEPSVEKIPLTAMEDKGVLEKWGDNIYRINFTIKSPKVNDKMGFVITVK